MQKSHRQASPALSRSTGARVLFQPSYRLVMVQAIKNLLDGAKGHFITWEVLKSIPLMKGVDRATAKRSCDMMQGEYDRECKPIRVYLFIGNDPCPTYAGLAGVSK